MEFLKHLDHPLLFLLFLFMALKGFEAVVTWAAKEAGLNGLAVLAQHP
jgi:hypothetical protein